MTERKDASKTKASPSSGHRRLGRGLGSLISAPVRIDASQASLESLRTVEVGEAGDLSDPSSQDSQRIVSLLLTDVYPNPNQPRQNFDEASLESLSQSIRTAGIMQPIVVRSRRSGGFELVAGERRWRAAARIGLKTIPAVVRAIDDRQASEWALIENLQREDLNPIERAEAFQRLVLEFRLTHQEVADRVGLTRSNISNHLRLLDLEREILDMVRDGHLSFGHARALLAFTNNSDRKRLAVQAAREEWSVRELERRAGGVQPQAKTSPSPASSRTRAHVQDLERRLSEHLGTRVQIKPGRKKGAGWLEIAFYSVAEFEGLMRRIDFRTEDEN